MKYLVVVEPTETGYSGYIPDLEGCVASAPNKDLLLTLLKEGVSLHLEELAAQQIDLPKAKTETLFLEV